LKDLILSSYATQTTVASLALITLLVLKSIIIIQTVLSSFRQVT